MTKHQVEFSYKLPEWGALEIDIDPVLDRIEQEEIAIREIKEVYDDIVDIEITKMEEVV